MVSKYGTSLDLWKNLGEDAYTKVIGEIAGTGTGVATSFSLDNDNLVSGSATVYSGGSVVPGVGYTLDLDNGIINFTSAPGSGSEVTCDYFHTGVPDSIIQTILERADDELEKKTGRSYDLQTSSEYLDVEQDQKVFFLSNIPVISMVSLSANTADSVIDTPSWSASTEGLGNDYLLDKAEGKIEYIDNAPDKGRNRLYATYIHGYSSSDIPGIATDLHRLFANRILAHNTVYQAYVRGRENFAPTQVTELNSRIMELQKLLTKNAFERV